MKNLLVGVICGTNKDMIRLCLVGASLTGDKTQQSIKCKSGIEIQRFGDNNSPARCGVKLWDVLKSRQLGHNYTLSAFILGQLPKESQTTLSYSDIKSLLPSLKDKLIGRFQS